MATPTNGAGSPAGPFGDIPLIADTSVWAKLHYAPAELVEAFRRAARDGRIVGSTIVRLELLHHAKTGADFDAWDERLAALPREIPITRKVGAAAVGALRDLRASGGDGYHRVGLPDALIAASAQEASVNVLHDNPGDFERLAEVLAFEPVRFGPF